MVAWVVGWKTEDPLGVKVEEVADFKDSWRAVLAELSCSPRGRTVVSLSGIIETIVSHEETYLTKRRIQGTQAVNQ